MTDLVRGMILGALMALYFAWLLLDFVPVLRIYAFRRSVMREAERRSAAAEQRLTRGWTSQREFRRGSNPPPNSVKPSPPSPPPMRVITEGGAPWRVPSPHTRDDTQ